MPKYMLVTMKIEVRDKYDGNRLDETILEAEHAFQKSAESNPDVENVESENVEELVV